MTAYYADDISFELPAPPAVDRTLHVLELRRGRRRLMTLTVARAPLEPGATLRGRVGAHLAGERCSLRGWSLLFDQAGEAAGRPVIEVGAEWHGDRGRMYRRQAHVALPDAVLLFTGDVAFAARELCDEQMARVLASLRLRA
jgi:hypothetical protein